MTNDEGSSHHVLRRHSSFVIRHFLSHSSFRPGLYFVNFTTRQNTTLGVRILSTTRFLTGNRIIFVKFFAVGAEVAQFVLYRE